MSERLALQAVRKAYPGGGGRLEVLRGVDLRLAAGQVATVVGDSGSGKSTLLQVAGGMDPPDVGEVRVCGVSLYGVDAETRARLRNRHIGFVFQFHHLLPEFDARDNVAMPLRIRGATPAVARRRADELLDEVGLTRRATHRPGELSGGEQQRVAIARALAGEPELLLLDEPTGNLDPRTGATVADLIFELADRRRLAVLLVTHNPTLAGRGNPRLVMVDGRLEAQIGAAC